MEAKQLSVFIENREGRLDEVLKVLKDSGVNILSLSLADTSEYGLLRLMVNKPEIGHNVLKENGFSSMLTNVLVVRLDHRVGSLQELLTAIAQADINLEYMYGLTIETDGKASLVLKTSNLQRATDILKEKGVAILTSEDISRM